MPAVARATAAEADAMERGLLAAGLAFLALLVWVWLSPPPPRRDAG